LWVEMWKPDWVTELPVSFCVGVAMPFPCDETIVKTIEEFTSHLYKRISKFGRDRSRCGN